MRAHNVREKNKKENSPSLFTRFARFLTRGTVYPKSPRRRHDERDDDSKRRRRRRRRSKVFFFFPMVPVNSYVSTTSTTTVTTTTTTPSIESPMSQQIGRPMFSLQPLIRAPSLTRKKKPLKRRRRRRKGRKEASLSFTSSFVKTFGHPTTGSSTNDRVYVRTNRDA